MMRNTKKHKIESMTIPGVVHGVLLRETLVTSLSAATVLEVTTAILGR